MTYTVIELLQGEETLAEDCERCGICCSGHVLKITPQEWNTIAHALGTTRTQLCLNTRAVPIPVTDPETYWLTVYPCPFQDIQNECIIHSIRPQVCRDWPYLKAIQQTEMGEIPNLDVKCYAVNRWKKRIGNG